MIKILLTGIWAAFVTLGASYGAMTYMPRAGEKHQSQETNGGLDSLKTSEFSVPIVWDGAIEGYVVAQFSFTIATAEAKSLSIEPEDYILSAAFREIYETARIEKGRYKKLDISTLTRHIAENVNKRFRRPLVRDVLVQSLKFVKKGMARGRNTKPSGQSASKGSNGH